MNTLLLLSALGGLAFFLYGMNVLSNGLEKLTGGKMQKILKSITKNKFQSLAVGAIVTVIIQSSSAVTVMLVGLVGSGLLNLTQSAGLIMGANIGTTVTSWILSLIGIESNNLLLNLLKPENFSLIFAVIGILMLMISKKAKRKDAGRILLGFSILMYGLNIISASVSPLKENAEFTNILLIFKNPVLGILAGTVLTAVLQSSSASVGVLQALSLTGNISYGLAIPIIMGQNIGTCFTVLISSLGSNKNAKKVAVFHVSFNVLGAIILGVSFYVLNAIFNFQFIDFKINPAGIAFLHTLFNVLTTAVLLPFSKFLVSFSEKVLKDTDVDNPTELLNSVLLQRPSVAVSECYRLTKDMAKTSFLNAKKATEQLFDFNDKEYDKAKKTEQKIDLYQDKLGTYLLQIENRGLSEDDSKKRTKMLHMIADFERIGDYAETLFNLSLEIKEKEIKFSNDTKTEVNTILTATKELLAKTLTAFLNSDQTVAEEIEPLDQVIDKLLAKIKSNHILRMEKKEYKIETSFILYDILNSIERISAHCSNIAVAIIEIPQNSFDTHKYLNDIRRNNNQFNNYYSKYYKKYNIKIEV